MNAHKYQILQAARVASALTLIASSLIPASAAVAADLPIPPRAPGWSWTGFYLGGSAGAAAGAATFSDPQGPSVFGDKVNTAAFLAGLQLGYNWQVAPRWVLGVQGDLSFLDSNGSFTCMQASAELIGSNCQVSPRLLTSLTGRLGYLVGPLGHTMLYGKGGAAWVDSDISITPNLTGFPAAWNAPDPGAAAHEHGNAWGFTVGAGIEHALTPAWSVGLEYDYYRFATFHVSSPDTISSSGTNDAETTPSTFQSVAGGRSVVTSDLQVLKLALNYRWGQDPAATWAEAPVFALAAMPVKAPPARLMEGWTADAGVRYWYSTGREKNTSGSGSLTSQLEYSGLTGQSGELFARVDTPSHLFVKGFVGTGALTGGAGTDEDWGNATNAKSGFMVSNSTTSGWLNYAAADVGFNALHDRDYKVGPFVGYSYFRQNINAFGCSYSVPTGQPCIDSNNVPTPASEASLTQDETWQSLRVGASAVATLWDRFGINGDVAYLPYAHYSGQDSHLLRTPVTLFPQDGSGRGVQTELILTYLATENLKLGIGGRYWAMWTTSASQSCHGSCDGGASSSPPGQYTANTERFGTFVQMSYRFNVRP
jgi:opacity protein-like surface antigen/outer membrane protease